MSSNSKWQMMSVDKLVPAAWNYKKENDFIQSRLTNNIKRNGQVENIIVRELETGFFEVVNGNHRLTSFKDLGLNEVMVFNLGSVSSAEAIRLAAETNETRFQSDTMLLAERLKEISTEFPKDTLLETLPFTAVEYDGYMALLDKNWDNYSSNEPQDTGESGSTDEFKKIELYLPTQVAELFQEQIERFKKLLYPDRDSADVSLVPVIEAMTATLAQTDDEGII